MDISGLCLSCFRNKGGSEYCVHCGYKEGTPAQNEVHLAPGTVLKGQYLVGRVLGYGGFGVTYLAYDLNLQQLRAIKEYLPGELSTRGTDGTTVHSYSGEAVENYTYGLEKFIEEGRLLAKFAGIEAVVSVYDYFRENNTAYIVMEYLGGMDLGDYLDSKGGRMSWVEAESIFAPIMLALEKVHITGMVHRDIAPDNIFITNDGKVKLLDFGAARQAIGEKSESLSVILKPGYAPPEQYHTRGKQGPWTDIYALGATIYRSLTGTTPTESLTRVMNDDLKPVSELGVSIPQNAELALAQSLNLDENARFKDMGAFYASLFQGVATPKVKNKAALIGGGESFAQKVKTTIFKPLVIKVTATVLSVALICTILFSVILPLINYNTAVAWFKGGQYEKAGDSFRKFGSYKESVMYLARSLYREGEADYEHGAFKNAKDPFEELAVYYPELEALTTDAIYMYGVSLGVDGDFEGAISVLELISGYINADKLVEAARREDIQPFLDEALDHELPVSEVEVIETVAEHEDYSDDVVRAHINDAGDDEQEESEPVSAATPAGDAEQQYPDYEWILEVLYDSEGTDDLEQIMNTYGVSGEVMAIGFDTGAYDNNEGGEIIDYVINMVTLRCENGTAEIQIRDEYINDAVGGLNSLFPFDYFAMYPADYGVYGVVYLLEYGDTEDFVVDDHAPVFHVLSQYFAIESEDALNNFSNVIDIDNLSYKDISDYNYAYVSGTYQNGVVSISSDFGASRSFTEVYYQPAMDSDVAAAAGKEININNPDWLYTILHESETALYEALIEASPKVINIQGYGAISLGDDFSGMDDYMDLDETTSEYCKNVLSEGFKKLGYEPFGVSPTTELTSISLVYLSDNNIEVWEAPLTDWFDIEKPVFMFNTYELGKYDFASHFDELYYQKEQSYYYDYVGMIDGYIVSVCLTEWEPGWISMIGVQPKDEIIVQLSGETTEKPQEDALPTPTPEDTEFVLPDSDSRVYSAAELKTLSNDEVRTAINEMYARHGAIFETNRWQSYFGQFSWYSPVRTKNEARERFNSYEDDNLNRLTQIEEDRGVR